MANDFQSIESSNLDAAKYDAQSKKLTVRFKNESVYEYSGVPFDLWKQFQKTFDGSTSAGSFFAKRIRQFPAKRITEKV